MVKQGPCHHCGVTSTPLWRNGPADKPVLCNACGSRWRTKGSLTNYTPLHSRAEPDEFMEYKVQRMKAISLKQKEAKVLKRKQDHDVEVVVNNSQKGAWDAVQHNRGYLKTLDEDISNRSSSASAISNSESCVHLGSADVNDLKGAAQSIVRDGMLPSRKRTFVGRTKQSSVEKLTKDLYNILQEQQMYYSGSTDEDLLLECDTPVVSVEIGHGSVLMQHPSSIAREEESEASSLSVYRKPRPANEACSQFTTRCDHALNKFDKFSSSDIEIKKPGQEKEEELYKRKEQQEELEILENHKSPICSTELKDARCKTSIGGSLVARGDADFAAAQSLDTKRSRDGQLLNCPGGKKLSQKTNYEYNMPIHNHMTSFSPKCLLEVPPDSTSHMLDSFQFVDESSDHDILLNITSQSSFPQAELLGPNSGFGAQASTSSSSIYQNHVSS